MILVDTSVWVDHLRRGDDHLASLLEQSRVLCHPMIIGELACGTLRNRSEILGLLANLPAAIEASHDEVLLFIEQHSLMGHGIGYIDMHLLASTTLSQTQLWTRDTRLQQAAAEGNVRYNVS